MIELVLGLILIMTTGVICLQLAKDKGIYYVPAALSFLFSGILVMRISSYNTPSAMDVYNGKATLEITYRDSVPVDTAVVFKK